MRGRVVITLSISIELIQLGRQPREFESAIRAGNLLGILDPSITVDMDAFEWRSGSIHRDASNDSGNIIGDLNVLPRVHHSRLGARRSGFAREKSRGVVNRRKRGKLGIESIIPGLYRQGIVARGVG